MQLSIVCPFYNEEAILEKALDGMQTHLNNLNLDWELIVVNDGSIDGSLDIATERAKTNPRLRVASYPVNKGRGHALRTGIAQARGEIIVTTEIDLSWGENIVEELYQALADHPEISFVLASPNLPGGGYRDVPANRIRVSRWGNHILSAVFSFRYTMHTGMTRAYRREIIQNLEFRENGKEFHLECLLKLTALGHQGMEIPAILAWKDKALAKKGKVRKSSSKIPKLIMSHLNFAVMANPIRYFWLIAVISAVLGVTAGGIGLVRMALGEVAIFYLLVGLMLLLFAVIFFGFGIVTAQNRAIMEELWLIRGRESRKTEKSDP